MDEEKKLLHWISMYPGSHFYNLKVKSAMALEDNQQTGLYATDENKDEIIHLCNLMKAFIKANYPKAKFWYEDLPKEYVELIPKLGITREDLMT